MKNQLVDTGSVKKRRNIRIEKENSKSTQENEQVVSEVKDKNGILTIDNERDPLLIQCLPDRACIFE